MKRICSLIFVVLAGCASTKSKSGFETGIGFGRLGVGIVDHNNAGLISAPQLDLVDISLLHRKSGFGVSVTGISRLPMNTSPVNKDLVDYGTKLPVTVFWMPFGREPVSLPSYWRRSSLFLRASPFYFYDPTPKKDYGMRLIGGIHSPFLWPLCADALVSVDRNLEVKPYVGLGVDPTIWYGGKIIPDEGQFTTATTSSLLFAGLGCMLVTAAIGFVLLLLWELSRETW
ncbi:MAG: hypothetical protein ABIM74_05415 [candidate division WOR-3 bacterium]